MDLFPPRGVDDIRVGVSRRVNMALFTLSKLQSASKLKWVRGSVAGCLLAGTFTIRFLNRRIRSPKCSAMRNNSHNVGFVVESDSANVRI